MKTMSLAGPSASWFHGVGLVAVLALLAASQAGAAGYYDPPSESAPAGGAYQTDADVAPDTDPGNATQAFVIPLGAVVPVSLDTTLSSSTGAVGDRFTTTIRSNEDGDADLPRGTRIVGSVVGVQKAGDGRPGVLYLSFREARLPDGSTVPLDGSVISLDSKTVTTSSDGRLVATAKPTKANRNKMIGIGAGAGLVIGRLLRGDMLLGGLLGAAAGYFYGEHHKGQPKDAVVNEGTVFGVRMDREVTYDAPHSFVAERDAHLNMQ